jgi:methionyl aminopeptidase
VVLHYDDPDVHIPLEPGMTFTIEPMITVGSSENEKWADDWTVVTRDGSRTAQFEHTILVTGDGAGILTLP